MQTEASQIEVVEEEQSYEGEEVHFQYEITSYGADYPVDGLVKRMDSGAIYIPSLQRGYVWTHKQASAFIESLLIGLPIPSIFLAKEDESNRLLVIDGQQRLRTLQYFYSGRFSDRGKGKDFILVGVGSRFEGLSYQSLSEDQRIKLDDSLIPAIIIKQDRPANDSSSIYLIFERLNTGGTKLTPQEIRSCIYHGQFNQTLEELNQVSSWRDIFGPVDRRMKDQELILRFLSLYIEGESYKKPMKEFLNNFMETHKDLGNNQTIKLKSVFVKTINLFYEALGSRAFKPKARINSAVFDAMMVGLARSLDRISGIELAEIRETYETLLENENFREAAINTARTTDEREVKSRLKITTDAFAKLST